MRRAWALDAAERGVGTRLICALEEQERNKVCAEKKRAGRKRRGAPHYMCITAGVRPRRTRDERAYPGM